MEVATHGGELKAETQADLSEAQGTIRLGCHSAVAQYTLPLVLPNFLERYPLLDIQLIHGLSRQVTEQVVSSQLDIAIAVNPIPNPDLIIRELCKDQVCLWQAKGNKNPDVLILEPSLLQAQNIMKNLRKSNTQFKRIIESSSLEVIASLVASGVGCGILPERILQVQGLANTNVSRKPLFITTEFA